MSAVREHLSGPLAGEEPGPCSVAGVLGRGVGHRDLGSGFTVHARATVGETTLQLAVPEGGGEGEEAHLRTAA